MPANYLCTSDLFGVSLNKPHTSVTSLCLCVCKFACLFDWTDHLSKILNQQISLEGVKFKISYTASYPGSFTWWFKEMSLGTRLVLSLPALILCVLHHALRVEDTNP